MKNTLSRRSFVKRLGAAGIATGLGTIAATAVESKPTPASTADSIRNYTSSMAYRTIGSTGIAASVFAIGTGNAKLELLREALDMGINFFHASYHYMGGRSLGILGEAIKGKTDKVHLALKDDFPSIEKALKILGVPSVDFLMFNRHNASDLQKELPAIKEKFSAWKDKGLVKFAGLTVHKDTAAVLDVAADAGLFACVMPAYPPKQLEQLAPQIEKLRAKNIALLAMKSKGELNSEDFAAHIPKLLSDKNLSAIIKGVGSSDELKSWATAAATTKTGFLYRMLNRYAEVNYSGCNLCGVCEKVCPAGIATADIMRCIRYYHDSEKLPVMASSEFRAMNLSGKAFRCDNCGKCEAVCPQRLSIMSDIQRAERVLA